MGAGFFVVDKFTGGGMTLRAYDGPDGTGTLLTTLTAPTSNYQRNNLLFMGITDDSSNIRSLVWYIPNNGGDDVAIDDIRFAGGVIANPDIGVDSSGDAHIIWSDKGNTDEILYSMVNGGTGATMIDDTRVSNNNGFPSSFPRVDVRLSDNTLGLVWEEDIGGGQCQVIECGLDPSQDDQDGSSSTDATLTLAGLDDSALAPVFGTRATKPTITMGPTEHYVAWQNMMGNGMNHLVYVKFDVDGDFITFHTSLDNDVFQSDTSPAIASGSSRCSIFFTHSSRERNYLVFAENHPPTIYGDIPGSVINDDGYREITMFMNEPPRFIDLNPLEHDIESQNTPQAWMPGTGMGTARSQPGVEAEMGS